MSSKTQAIVSSIFAAMFGFINWLATVPPEQQSGILATLVEVTPVQWRPTVGVWTRALMMFLGIYATYKAAHSGPQTPPKNPPQ